MSPKLILETKRLLLRELVLLDADFILDLLNSPNWLKFIGDRDVHSLKDAEKYLTNGPINSYKKNEFGLWLVMLKESNTPIGICGILQRDYLENVDIGFALLPEFEGLGYAFEMAKATIEYSRKTLAIDMIMAITNEENGPSIKLLKKLGLHFKKKLETPQNDSVYLFSE